MHNGSDTPEVLNMHVVTREVFMADDSMVYIGRGSKWGNPFVIGADGTREEVIAQYRDWILTRDELLESLGELEGKDLVCYCAPKPCHGDILINLTWWKDRT